MIDHGIGVIAHGTGVIDHGVRVSAYGISHQWLRCPHKRLRSVPGHTDRSARSAGPIVGLARDVQPAVATARFE
jgi:hypothetical protein